MVVPVLITSCQLSEKLKIGPVTPQAITTSSATMKAQCDPTPAATAQEKRRNQLSRLCSTRSNMRRCQQGRKCSNATETPGDQCASDGSPSGGRPAAAERSSRSSLICADISGHGSCRTGPRQSKGPSAGE